MLRTLVAFLVVWCICCGQTSAQGACLDEIKPQLKQLDEQIKALNKKNVSVSGPRTPPGPCTARLEKLVGNFLYYTGGPAEAEHNNQISCLELKKLYLRQACECRAKNLEFSDDDGDVDKTIEAQKRLARAQKEIRRRAIKNPLIRKWVDEASKVRDCYSLATIKVLDGTAASLEKLLEGP